MVIETFNKFLNENTEKVIRENLEPESRHRILDSDNENYDLVMDQFSHDPNKDEDSGMSFDTEALHNLDT